MRAFYANAKTDLADEIATLRYRLADLTAGLLPTVTRRGGLTFVAWGRYRVSYSRVSYASEQARIRNRLGE